MINRNDTIQPTMTRESQSLRHPGGVTDPVRDGRVSSPSPVRRHRLHPRLRVGQTVIAGAILLLVASACSSGQTETAGTVPPSTDVLPQASTTLLEPAPTSSSTSTTPAPSGPGYGGVAIIGDDQSPPTINPYAPGGDNFVVAIVGQAWLTGAWDIDATTLEMIPEVVTALPTTTNGGIVVNQDGTMTVNYRILDEAMWEDRTPISGYDFQFTLDTLLKVEQGSEARFGYMDAAIIGSKAGDKTFSMTLERPTLVFEELFRWLIPKHAVEGTAFPDDWVDTPWPSGGPFIIDTITPGDRIVMVRNKNYWKTDEESGLRLPFLDGVEFRVISETSSLVRAFTRRDIDVFQPPPSIRDVINPLKTLESDGAIVTVQPGLVWEHINFQFGPRRLELSPNSCNENLAFRRAIMHAIDRQAAVEAIYGDLNSPMGSYIDAFAPNLATDAWARYPYDPTRARELYGQAVEETGRECTAVFSTSANADMRPRLANLYVDMLAKAGIPMELELMDSQPFFGEVLPEGSWDVGQWAWVGSSGLSGLIEFHNVFDPRGVPPDGSNFYRWGTSDSSVNDAATRRFAEIVEAMDAIVDDVQLRSLIAEAEKILADQAVILPLFSRLLVGAVWADEIGGYVLNSSKAGPTWNIEDWYRTDR